MVLTYMGRYVSYERLLKLLRVRSNIGAPASNIRLLEKLDVQVLYQPGTQEMLYKHLVKNQPCIAFMDTGELPYWHERTAHAIVVAGLDDRSIYLNDPAFPDAPLQISHGDFDLAWLEWDEYYSCFDLTSGSMR